ncbi:MAG: sensor histidine kinase, partial [Acidimicrobiales bacterium]
MARHRTHWLTHRPLLADGLLAAALLGSAVAIAATDETRPGERPMNLLAWALLLAGNAAIAWRRRAPVVVGWSVLAATVPFWVLDHGADEALGMSLLVAPYSVAAHVDRPRSLVHGAGIVASAMLVTVVGVLVPHADLPWPAIPANALVFATAWILGDNLRTRRAYLHELETSAAMSETRRVDAARRAAAEERARIARELHDVVAHSVSVMVVQAGAGRRMMDSDPRQAAEALATIEHTGRESLTEMRRVLDVLRDDDETALLGPSPTLRGLSGLARRCEEAGLPVELVVEGEVRDLPGGLELSVFRLVQESLTNSVKHAGPARARVRLEYTS